MTRKAAHNNVINAIEKNGVYRYPSGVSIEFFGQVSPDSI